VRSITSCGVRHKIPTRNATNNNIIRDVVRPVRTRTLEQKNTHSHTITIILLLHIMRCGAACAAYYNIIPACNIITCTRRVRIKADHCLCARASALPQESGARPWIYSATIIICTPDGLCRRSAPAAAAKTRGLVTRRKPIYLRRLFAGACSCACGYTRA